MLLLYARLSNISRDGWYIACPMVSLLLLLVLNQVSLHMTADRLSIYTETEQDSKLDIHLYNKFIVYV